MLLVLALAVGCASVSDRSEAARVRAAHDLPCPAQSIKVTHLSRDVYRVEGCSKTVIYTCALGLNGKISCSE